MNWETLQNAINNGGYIELPAGEHYFTEPFKVRAERKVHIDGRRCKIRFSLPENRGLFEVHGHQKWGQGRFRVENLDAKQAYGDKTRNSVILTAEDFVQVDSLRIEGCQFRANRGYCIDMKNTGYCVAPVIRNLLTIGAGSIRWTGHRDWGKLDAMHATSQLTIENVRHLGGSRIHAAFMFRGCGGLRMSQIIDEGSCSVASHRRDAPFALGLHIEKPITPSIIEGYWFEPWGSFAETAPNHWMFTFKDTGSQSTGRHAYVQARIDAMKTSAFDIEGPKVKVIGGGKHQPGSRSKNSIFVDLLDAWQPSVDEYSTEGKSLLRFIRPRHDAPHKLRKLEKKYSLIDPMTEHPSAYPYIGTHEVDIHDGDAWL